MSGWTTKKLGEVCESISTRGCQIQQNEICDIGKFPVVSQSEAFIEGYTDFENAIENIPVVLFGDHTCCVKYIDFPFVVGADGTKLLTSKQLEVKFLYYAILKIRSSLVDGKYRRHFKDLKKCDNPIPPLAEQKRIVAKIDAAFEKIDRLKANAEKNLANAKELFQSALDEAFKTPKGDKVRLGDVCDVLAGYPFKGNAFSETGIKICGGLIITPTEIKWSECKHWDSSEGLEDYLLAADDIVIALDRPWIADGFKIGMIEESDLPCLLIQRTARLRAKKVIPKYLLYVLRHPAFKEYCTFTGATVPHISHKDIERYMIPCPPLTEQKQIAKRLDILSQKTKALQQNYAQQIADCAEMRQAILREAFEGRL